MSHKIKIRWKVFNQHCSCSRFIRLFPDGNIIIDQLERYHIFNAIKISHGKHSQPSSESVKTSFSQLSSHSSLSDNKSRNTFFRREGGRSEGGRGEVESPFVHPGQLLPHVQLSDCLTHTAIIQLRHKSGDTHDQTNIYK